MGQRGREGSGGPPSRRPEGPPSRRPEGPPSRRREGSPSWRPEGPLATALFGCLAGFVITALCVKAPWASLPPFAKAAPGSSVGAASAAPRLAAVAATSPAAGVLASRDVSSLPSAPRTYNVILLTVDTLRSDLGFAGYPKPITPNIDALARRGAIFERTYATASFTPKSLGPLMIGRYAGETRRDFGHYTIFARDNVFVAERAHEAGVRTFACMCHRYFSMRNGLEQGFDVWDTSATPPNMTDSDPRSTSDRLTDVAIAQLGRPENVAGAGRFFAWFHYFDPHAPYVRHRGAPDFAAGERTVPGRMRAQYDEEVWFTDTQIGRLLDFIATARWSADTAIILTADHGEAFGEHGHWKHGRELWEALVRVPLIVVVPGATPRRISVKRSHIDLVPTILELLGLSVPGDDSLRGTSLRDEIVAEAPRPPAERDVYIDMPEGPFNETRRALVSGPTPGRKLIDIAGRRFELYDLATDPGELVNLAGDATQLGAAVEQLRRLRAGLAEIAPTK